MENNSTQLTITEAEKVQRPNRLRKNRRRKITRYLCPEIPHSLILDWPLYLWASFERRAEDLGIPLPEFLHREKRIDQAIAAQLASLDPAVAAQGGQTGKVGPQRIERIFSRLKQ